MARFNFAGGSYQSEGLGFDCQRSVNLYPELHELGDGYSKMSLLYTPGLKQLVALDGPPRGQYEFNGRLFVVGSQTLYEVIPTFSPAGALLSATTTPLSGSTLIANDLKPVSMAANENQLLFSSAGFVYIYYINAFAGIPAGTFQQVPPSNFTLASGNAPVAQVAFCNSFFLALMANSQTIGISNVLDGLNWNLNGQIVVSVFPDNVVSIWVDHGEVWMLGRKKTAVYAPSGSSNVFDPIPGAFIEQGAGAAFTTCSLDNSIFWLGADDKGQAIGWRANGYIPVRISTHPIELAWQSYPKVSDAVSYSYQERGHSFWVIFFPSANNFAGATWVYDAATGLWHERDQLNTQTGLPLGHPSWNHAFAFGQHIVGDWGSSNLYVMSKAYYDNNGTQIIKQRIAPHIFTEQERIDHHRFELACDMGVGWSSQATNPDGSQMDPPQVFLDWSNDGGKTWSNKRGRSFGYLGETRLPRPVWRRLGQARVRTYRITCSDAVPLRMYDAFVNADPGFTPTERIVHQLRKSA